MGMVVKRGDQKGTVRGMLLEAGDNIGKRFREARKAASRIRVRTIDGPGPAESAPATSTLCAPRSRACSEAHKQVLSLTAS